MGKKREKQQWRERSCFLSLLLWSRENEWYRILQRNFRNCASRANGMNWNTLWICIFAFVKSRATTFVMRYLEHSLYLFGLALIKGSYISTISKTISTCTSTESNSRNMQSIVHFHVPTNQLKRNPHLAGNTTVSYICWFSTSPFWLRTIMTLWLCSSCGIPLGFLINAHSYGVPQLCAVVHWLVPKTNANSPLLRVHSNCLFTWWHTARSMRITQEGRRVNAGLSRRFNSSLQLYYCSEQQ